MKLKAFSIYDRKALAYHPPFFAPTDGAAVRSFSDLANDTSTSVGSHPGDYVLYCVGEYDDSNGALTPTAPLRHVSDAEAHIKIQTGFSFTDPHDGIAKNVPVNGAAK